MAIAPFDEAPTFDVLVRTRRSVVLVARHIDRRTATLVARLQSERSGQPAYVRDHQTRAIVQTVEPPA
jgi:hypothetical protein